MRVICWFKCVLFLYYSNEQPASFLKMQTNLASCTKSTLTLSEESRKRSSLKQKLRPDFIFGEIYGRLLVEETAV